MWWRIGRASLGFLCDTFAISRAKGDLVDPLILSAILEANVAPINNDPVLSPRFATLDDPPPDTLRRPVSVNAVAASLRMPYETVRRHVAKMVRLGAVTSTPRGVVVTTAAVDSPFYRMISTARYERMKRFYFELKALDGLRELVVRPAEAPRHALAPIRLANRVLSEYSLRMVDSLMKRVGDPVTGMLLLEIATANCEHLTPEQLAFEGPMPDAARLPIPVLALARRVRMPPETVRRHVARLEKNGFCRKAKGGWLAVLEQLGRGEGNANGLVDNLNNVQRMFARCAVLGVVAYWEDEARADAAA